MAAKSAEKLGANRKRGAAVIWMLLLLVTNTNVRIMEIKSDCKLGYSFKVCVLKD